MESELITIISTLGAVLLGFLLSQFSEYIRVIKENNIQKGNIHNLIGKETKQNIKLITEFWTLISLRLEEASPKEESARIKILAKIIGRSPSPHICTHVWHSNLNEIPRFFSQLEIDKLWSFYELLLEVKRKKEFFEFANNSRIQSLQFEKSIRGPATGYIDESIFYGQIKQHVSIFEEKVNNIITFELQ